MLRAVQASTAACVLNVEKNAASSVSMIPE